MSKPVIPMQSLLQGCSYVDAANTDIRKTFERIRALQQPKAPNVRTLKAKKS